MHDGNTIRSPKDNTSLSDKSTSVAYKMNLIQIDCQYNVYEE